VAEVGGSARPGPSVGFGTSIHQALRLAAFEAADETGAVLAALGAAGLEDRIGLDLKRIPQAW
jgi:hypothetical protein